MGCVSSKAVATEAGGINSDRKSIVKVSKNEKPNNAVKKAKKEQQSEDILLYGDDRLKDWKGGKEFTKKPPAPKPTYAVHTGSHKARLANESECWLRGAIFLDSGALVVADYKNNKLKMFDGTFQFVSELELPSGVWDVCSSTVSRTEVFATVPYKKEVHRISTDQSLTALDSFRTEGFCWGITSYDQGLAVSVKLPSKPLVPPFQVHLLDFDGTFKKSVAFDCDGMTLFVEPKFLAATHDGNYLLVSDYRKDCLYCLNGEERVIFTYTGMKSPSGVTTDDRNNIHLVSFYGTQRIHKLNTKGEKLDGLPPDEEKTLFPHGICYRKKDKLLLVTTDSDTMEAYVLV